MSLDAWQRMLLQAASVPGVRGALLVSIDDGLVVAESAMDSVETADVAALAAAVVQRAIRTARASGHAQPRSVRVTGEAGTMLAFTVDQPLWLVAIADPSAELGRLRLLLGDLAAAIS